VYATGSRHDFATAAAAALIDPAAIPPREFPVFV
jgi:hypothetical protein